MDQPLVIPAAFDHEINIDLTILDLVKNQIVVFNEHLWYLFQGIYDSLKNGYQLGIEESERIPATKLSCNRCAASKLSFTMSST